MGPVGENIVHDTPLLPCKKKVNLSELKKQRSPLRDTAILQSMAKQILHKVMISKETVESTYFHNFKEKYKPPKLSFETKLRDYLEDFDINKHSETTESLF